MNSILKNKRGDIPASILVLGTLAICFLALMSFFVSKTLVVNSFEGPRLSEEFNSKINEYNFYKSKMFTNQQIEIFLTSESISFGEDEQGKFMQMEKKKTKGILLWEREIILFSSKHYFFED